MWLSCGSGLRLSGILLRWSSGGSPLRPGLSQRGGCGCVPNIPEVLDSIRVLEMGWRVDNVECLQLCGTIQQQEAQPCRGPGPAWRSEACPGRSTKGAASPPADSSALETQQTIQPWCRWTWEELQYCSNFCGLHLPPHGTLTLRALENAKLAKNPSEKAMETIQMSCCWK